MPIADGFGVHREAQQVRTVAVNDLVRTFDVQIGFDAVRRIAGLQTRPVIERLIGGAERTATGVSSRKPS